MGAGIEKVKKSQKFVLKQGKMNSPEGGRKEHLINLKWRGVQLMGDWITGKRAVELHLLSFC